MSGVSLPLLPLLAVSPEAAWNWLIEPFQLGFMIRALWVSAFGGVVGAVIGMPGVACGALPS